MVKTVKILFEYFIANDYWKYHDHWLGYCTNELVQISSEESITVLEFKTLVLTWIILNRGKQHTLRFRNADGHISFS